MNDTITNRQRADAWSSMTTEEELNNLIHNEDLKKYYKKINKKQDELNEYKRKLNISYNQDEKDDLEYDIYIIEKDIKEYEDKIEETKKKNQLLEEQLKKYQNNKHHIKYYENNSDKVKEHFENENVKATNSKINEQGIKLTENIIKIIPYINNL